MRVSELEVVVAEIVDEMRRRSDRGEVATYIPELAAVDPKQFGLAVITADGHIAAGGDSDTPFSIQSISKVFTLTLALGKVGDRLWRRVGREPSGSPFNSVVQLEYEHGIPRNRFINAGAIAVTDIILSGHQPREVLGEILRFVRFIADDTEIVIDEGVCQIAFKYAPPFASNNDPVSVRNGRAETGGAEPRIAEQSRSWRAADGEREVMLGS
jgi:glutaminase